LITCFEVIYIFIDASWCNTVHVIVVVVFQFNDSIVVVIRVIIDNVVVQVTSDGVVVHVIIGAVVTHVVAVAEVVVAIFKISGCVVAVHVVIVLFFDASKFCVVVINIIVVVVVDVVGTGVDVNVCVGVDVCAGIGSGIIVAVDFVLFNC
jgi:hypothetical protein